MPRFLGIDYFAEAALQYRALLNRTLLAVPQHLEQIEKYAHSGTVQDDAYRTPWVRACANPKQLQLDDANLQADIAALPGKVVSQLEPFVSDRVLCYNDFGGIYEMVPSSNPESEDSVEDEVLRKLADETELLWDSFEKVDLKELHSTTEEGDDKLLEEVSSTDYLAGFARQMPALESMVKCLKPQLIKDPFVTDSGSDISEVHVMRSDMLYDNNSEQKHSETDNEEVVIYEKEALLHIEEKMLEEELLPSAAVGLEKPQLTVETHFCDSELQKFVTKLKQDMITEDNEPPQDYETLSKFSLAQGGLAESLNAPEKMTISPVATRDVSFTCLNEQGLEEQRDLKTSLLESPASVNTLPLPASHTHPWKDLQPLHITPVHEMCFMSPNKTQALVKQFWQRERYFSEILSLRLPEPDMTTAPENVPMSHVIEKLQLRCEESSGALELELSWDPTAGSTPTVLQALAQDRRLEWSSESGDVEAGTGDEVFDRAPLHEMHDDEISFPTCVCDGKDKHDCFSADIPPMKKDYVAFLQDKWHSQPDAGSHQDTCPAGTGWTKKQPEVASKPTVTRNKSASDKTTERIKPVIEDPLDQFILLRGGPVSEDSWTGPNIELTSKNATTLTSRPLQETREGLKQPSTPGTPGTPGREGRRRSKSKIIQVQLTDDFQEIHRGLQEAAQPSLSLLKQGGHIPHNRDITAFTPDVTRFILKQHEKSWSDSPAQSDDTCVEVYQAVIVLHCLVSAADVLLHGCLQAAVVQLSSLQVKHQTLLKGQLEGVRQHLLRLQHVHQQVHTQHPKLMVMARNIAEWLVRKKRKSPGHDPKILILSRRSMPSLLESIAESASLVADVNPCVQQVATCHAVLDSVERHNCLVLSAARLADDFPWAQFSLVIEYEYASDTSPWKQSCERQHIRFIGLETLVTGPQHQELAQEASFASLKPSAGQPAGRPFVFIGSHKLTDCTRVLQLLETRHNILILERDYRPLQHGTGLHFADVILDERNCIVLHSLSSLTRPQQVEPLVAMVTALGVKYEMCWLVLFSQQDTAQYPYAGSAVSNIARLQAAVSLFSFKTDAYKVKVLLCGSETETAAVIREVGELVCDLSPVWTRDDWTHRHWLSPELTQHEKLLLMFPCLNSFSAQILLSSVPLKSLLTASLETLTQLCPRLPQKMIQMFYTYTHWKCSLQTVPTTAEVCPDTDPAFPSTSHNYATHTSGSLHQGLAMPVESNVEHTHSHSLNTRENLPRSNMYNRKNPMPHGVTHKDVTDTYTGVSDLCSDWLGQGLTSVNTTTGLVTEDNSPNQTVPTWGPGNIRNSYTGASGTWEMPDKYDRASRIHHRPPEVNFGQLDPEVMKPFDYSATVPSSQHVNTTPRDVSLYTGLSVQLPSDVTKACLDTTGCDTRYYDMNPAVGDKPVVLQSPLEFITGHTSRSSPVIPEDDQETAICDSRELGLVDHPQQHYQTSTYPQQQTQSVLATSRQDLAHTGTTAAQNMRRLQVDTTEPVGTGHKQLVSGIYREAGSKRSVFPFSIAKTTLSVNSQVPSGQRCAEAIRGESTEAPVCGEYRNYEGMHRVKLWTEFGDVRHHGDRLTGGVIRAGGRSAHVIHPVTSLNRPPDGNSKYNPELQDLSPVVVGRSSPWSTGATGRAHSVATPSSSRHSLGDVSKTPGSRSSTPNRTPSIAPVTPCVRQPVQALKLGAGDVGDAMRTRGSRTPQAMRARPDSPPMDLDSDDETSVSSQQFYCKPWQRLENMPSQPGCTAKGFEETAAPYLLHPHCGVVSLTPSKKRRLTYEKLPGHVGGQTRLTFM